MRISGRNEDDPNARLPHDLIGSAIAEESVIIEIKVAESFPPLAHDAQLLSSLSITKLPLGKRRLIAPSS